MAGPHAAFALLAVVAAAIAARPLAAGAQEGQEPVLESSLEVLDIETGQRRVVYHVRGHIEAPNWSPDGRTLLYNSGGRIWTIPADGGEPRLLDTGFDRTRPPVRMNTISPGGNAGSGLQDGAGGIALQRRLQNLRMRIGGEKHALALERHNEGD